MTGVSRRQALATFKKAVLFVLAGIGCCAIGLPVACTMVRPAFYADDDFPAIMAPGGRLAAFRRVTTGGFGTVWTTKIFIKGVPKGEEFIVYEARDSDHIPNYRWADSETLLVELPCDRVDYLSNPGDYDEGDTPMQRVAVRFTYPSGCSPTTLAPKK